MWPLIVVGKSYVDVEYAGMWPLIVVGKSYVDVEYAGICGRLLLSANHTLMLSMLVCVAAHCCRQIIR